VAFDAFAADAFAHLFEAAAGLDIVAPEAVLRKGVRVFLGSVDIVTGGAR
jgi:hypothetical protein